MKPDLSVTIGELHLRNPVIAASGTFGYGVEFNDILSLNKLGAIIVKGLSRAPMEGNPAPRMIETASGMLNAIGLQNIGVDAFIEKRLPLLQRNPGVVVIANVFGFTVDDYLVVIERLNQAAGIAAYELNVSCPNTSCGGISFGSDEHLLEEIVYRARRASARPLIVKLSPNVTSIAQMGRIAEQSGADALTVANTFLAMAIDASTRRPRIANVTAGLSGPAIKPITLRMVYETTKAVSIPVIASGGASTAEDVVEFMLAGARAVQVGTASYADPRATERIANRLGPWCTKHDVDRLSDLVGGLRLD
jgi:dihydroorotate dehydrogenase (NAD+) catalytic subunit